MKASESLILTLKQGWIAKTSSCKEQIFSWSQSGEWGCKSSETGGVRSPGGHHSKSTSLGQELCGRHHLQCSLLIPGGRRCPCSWPNFVPLEESSDSAWGSLRTREERESRPKGKGGHPWGVEVFTTPPLCSTFTFPGWESESRVCLFCDLLRVFVSIFVSL